MTSKRVKNTQHSQCKLLQAFTLLVVLLLMPTNLWADPVGYAILTDENGDNTKETLKFMYGEMPSGDDVWETTNTGTNNPGWYNSRNNITSVVFDSSFASARPQSCCKWFCQLSNVESITNLQYLDTREVTNMDQMFQSCSKLASLDLRSFNTSNVVTMNNMFYYCSSLTALDLRGLNTSNVTSMRSMFSYCGKLPSLDLSSFETNNVTTMSGMFFSCYNLVTLTLSNKFNTCKVENMSTMFQYCYKLAALDLSMFDTSKVTDMSKMFFRCYELASLDLRSFNTSNVTNMSEMFYDCWELASLDISSFRTSKVTTMNGMFCNCKKVTSLNVSLFDTSCVTDMYMMFAYCGTLTTLDMTHFDTSKVTNMSGLFYACSNLSSLDLRNFDTTDVTNMVSMFGSCSKLGSLNLSNFNTANVTNMNYMFQKCSNMLSLTIGSNYITNTNVTFTGMFEDCNVLNTITIIVDDNMPITKDIFSSGSWQWHPNLLVQNNSGVASSMIDNQISVSGDYISWKGCQFTSLNGRSVPSVNISISSGTYNGNPRTATLSSDIVSATFEYKLSSASDETYTTTAPTNVGAYTVKATTVGTETYFPITKTTYFNITTASLSSATVTGASVNADYGESPSIGSLTVNYPAADYVIWYRRAGMDDATTIPEESLGQYSIVLKPSETGNLTGEKETGYTVNVQLPVEFKQCEWVTYYDERFNLATPAGYQAYKVSGASSSGVTAEAIGYIPMGVPVILHTNKSGTSSEPMTIRLNEQTSTSGISGDAAYVGIPSTETSGVTPSGTAYILVGDQFVLYEGSAAIPAHRCYLSLTSEARKRSLGIDFGDGTTSLRELEESREGKEKREMWYTLDGRKLNTMPQKKGLYVRNGQKVVVK